MLHARMKKILQKLMATDSPITGTYLANINQVTVRTTREDIKQLADLLEKNGATIESLMGKGYRLTVTDEERFHNLLKEITSQEQYDETYIPKTPEERQKYLIVRFLLSKDYIKLEDIAEEIYVSRSTIQNDLKQVKTILEEYELSLKVRPNYGIKVTGDEMKLRFCISEYIFDRHDASGEQLPDPFLNAFDHKDLNKILEIIIDEINAHQITLSDIAINNLLVHIAIALKRIESGHHVQIYETDLNDIIDEKEYEVAQNIVEKIEDTFQVTFPQTEVAYITLHLLGTKILAQSNDVEDIVDEDILKLVTMALEKVDEEFNLDIRHDQELILGLSLHLKPAINRYKYGMNIRNPMLVDIMTNYPLAFEAAVCACVIIGKATGTEIDEDEVGYVALHIGAAMERRKLKSGPKRCLIVCASGYGTAQLIYYKLKNQFGKELDVVGATEYYRLQDYPLHEIDFIVSSIPIPDKLPVPVIEVNAIIQSRDIEKIEKFITNQKRHPTSYFQKEVMFFRKNFKTMDEVLTFLNERLLQKNLVDGTFLEAVYEREKIAPTSFGNLVAIPHPITPKTEKTFIAVCTLEKPVCWNEKPVQFVCLLCVKKNSEEDLQAMYEMLGDIIETSALVEKLIQARNYDEFIRFLI